MLAINYKKRRTLTLEYASRKLISGFSVSMLTGENARVCNMACSWMATSSTSGMAASSTSGVGLLDCLYNGYFLFGGAARVISCGDGKVFSGVEPFTGVDSGTGIGVFTCGDGKVFSGVKPFTGVDSGTGNGVFTCGDGKVFAGSELFTRVDARIGNGVFTCGDG
jgi:hypothetical protein